MDCERAHDNKQNSSEHETEQNTRRRPSREKKQTDTTQRIIGSIPAQVAKHGNAERISRAVLESVATQGRRVGGSTKLTRRRLLWT